MYYLFDDSGALIDEYESDQLELAFLNKDTFADSILLYYGEGAKDAWEHGIEVLAPEPVELYFIPYLYIQRNDIKEHKEFNSRNSLEAALEALKELYEAWRQNHEILAYGIEERKTIIHKVKIP